MGGTKVPWSNCFAVAGVALDFCATNAQACVRSRRGSASNLQVNTPPRPEAPLGSNVARIVFHEGLTQFTKLRMKQCGSMASAITLLRQLHQPFCLG